MAARQFYVPSDKLGGSVVKTVLMAAQGLALVVCLANSPRESASPGNLYNLKSGSQKWIFYGKKPVSVDC